MQGLRAIRRDPAVFLLEILWRWSFAAMAVLIVFFAGVVLLDKMHTDSLTRVLQTKDPRMIGTTMLFTWLLLGVKAIVAMIVVPLAIALVWTCFAAAARRITARRLRAAAPLRFGAMLMLQFVRAFSTWIAYMLLLGGVVLALRFATSGSSYNPVTFYIVASTVVASIVVLWLVLNWYFSIAAIFGREGQSFPGAFRHGRSIVRAQRSDFAGTGLIFLMLRLILLALVIAICGLSSDMQVTAPESYALLVMIVALVYFAVSDVLYVWRMASYVALAAAMEEEDVIVQLERSVRPPATSSQP